jgi:uncharacterized membrane protein YqhA
MSSDEKIQLLYSLRYVEAYIVTIPKRNSLLYHSTHPGIGDRFGFLCYLWGGALISLLVQMALGLLGLAHETVEMEQGVIIFEIVKFLHTFLVGTVLYITAMGLYQLFIKEIEFPKWLKIDSTEELETNLIGVTVVVLAVNFMGAIFARGTENLLEYGAGIALPIAALGLFVGLRTWSIKISKSAEDSQSGWKPTSAEESNSQEQSAK